MTTIAAEPVRIFDVLCATIGTKLRISFAQFYILIASLGFLLEFWCLWLRWHPFLLLI